MTALSADRLITRSEGEIVERAAATSTTVYGGSLCVTDGSGNVRPATDSSGNYLSFAGVAREQVTGNTTDTNYVELYQKGDFEFAFSGTAAKTTVGTAVYIVDDQTVGAVGTTTDDIACGKVVAYVSSSKVRVRIDGYAF